jgi:LacI family transcriptional regulator
VLRVTGFINFPAARIPQNHFGPRDRSHDAEGALTDMANRRKILVVCEKLRAHGRAVCEGVAAYAQVRGDWELHLADDRGNRELARQRGWDGVIARILTMGTLKAIRSMKIPVVDVFCWRRYPGIGQAEHDNDSIGRLAAGCFLARRFQQFAFCGYDGVPFSDGRCKSFARAVGEKGFGCDRFSMPPQTIQSFADKVILHEKFELDENRHRLGRWLQALPKPVGIFCSHDARAYQLATLCKLMGIRVPQEVALLGVDDDRLLCAFSSPMLSSIDIDGMRLGFEAAQLLQEMMERREAKGGGPDGRRVVVPPKCLVERASTEVYPVEPTWLAEVLVHIQRNYMKSLSADDIFKLAGRSHTVVSATFGKVLKTTVRKEIIRVRLGEARRLLKDTDLPVREIAALAGFATPQYFNLSFRKAHGVSPLVYRDQQRGISETRIS